MDDAELNEMIERADSNHDGIVTEEDFYNIMTKKNFVWEFFFYYSDKDMFSPCYVCILLL